MNIGLKIKQLRMNRQMTQEELADMIGLSAKAISRWENGSSYPDITLLPVIANIFEVTTDELLDVNSFKQEEEIKKIVNENHKYKHLGENEKSINYLRKALSKYPTSYKLMCELATSLHGYYYALYPNKVDELNEMISLSEKILDKCLDDDIRHKAIQILVNGYMEKGEKEKAKQFAYKMPVLYCCQNVLLENVYEDKILDNHLKNNILLITEWFQDEIVALCKNKDDITIINLRKKYIDFMKLVFENDNCGFFNERIYRTYFNIALSYAKLKKVDDAIDNLIECIKSAILFKQYDKVTFTSLLLNGLVADKLDTTSNNNLTIYDRIKQWIDCKEFDIIRDDNRFKEIEKLLEELNK